MTSAALDTMAEVRAMLSDARGHIGRLMRGEERAPPRPAREIRADSKDPINSSTEQIKLLRVVVVGPIAPEMRGAIVREVETADAAAVVATVEPVDAVIVPTEEMAEALAGVGRPVVVDRIEHRITLRARVIRARTTQLIAQLGKGAG
jgi:hypothetical protein